VLRRLGEIGGGERGDWGDRLARDTHGERFGLQSRAAAPRTNLGELVLPQKDADVLLVTLLLEPLEEWKDAEIAADFVVEQEVPLARRDILPRRIEIDATGPRRLPQQAPPPLVAWLGPRIDGALHKRAPRIGEDEGLVILQDRTEAVTRGACAARVIKGKERRREHRRGTTAGRAGGVRGKPPAITRVPRNCHCFLF